jgi:hypothetical protein
MRFLKPFVGLVLKVYTRRGTAVIKQFFKRLPLFYVEFSLFETAN